ncbi:MAG: glycosyltransferase family 9 protein [bacterium]
MIPSPPPRRILLVALDNLGDLVFASGLTPPLHAAFPDAAIDVWCKEYTAPVATLIPYVRDVIAADPFWAVPSHRPRPAILPFLRTVGAVRRNHYDIAVLSEAPWRTAAAVAAARIPVRIGLARHRNRAFLTQVLPEEDAHKPVVREQARLLSALGVGSANQRYQLDAERLGSVRTDVRRQLPAHFVAFHPFASTRDRCVPLEEWTQLATAMHARSLPVLWVGTPAELDELRRSNTQRQSYYVDQIGDGSLIVTAAALSLADLFAGHDSGPLHIAGAFGVPVVGVFAPGQPDRTFPQGTGPSRVVYSPSPDGITAATILREIDALVISSVS